MLTFLKLGGSLITDKLTPHTPRLEVIQRLAREILSARARQPDLQLVIGHGSGSFGHIPAKKFGTRNGAQTREDWHGFIEVWREARALNNILLDVFAETGLDVIAFPPSACVVADDSIVSRWDIRPISSAMAAGLIPLVYGDTVFDARRGATILSTEDLFVYLTQALGPQRILLAGIDEGVWADFPACTELVRKITPAGYAGLKNNIFGSAAVDVTGGMAEKVNLMLQLTAEIPGLQAAIFSGQIPGQLEAALTGDLPGTIIMGNQS